MSYKAKVNNVKVTYKSHTVIEIIKQYLEKNRDITYSDLKEIFFDTLQGSIGVIKNEEELKAWETKADNKKDTREKRFFTKSN